jgi:hypothetical protein
MRNTISWPLHWEFRPQAPPGFGGSATSVRFSPASVIQMLLDTLIHSHTLQSRVA